MIDLGGWASEAYRVPTAEAPDDRDARRRPTTARGSTLGAPAGQAARRSATPCAPCAMAIGKIGGCEPAEREHRQRRLGGDRREALPAERRRARMRRRRRTPDRAPRSRAPSSPARSISARVWHDAAHRRSSGRDVAAASARRRQVHAVASPCARASTSPLQQHLRAARPRERDERLGKRALPLRSGQLFSRNWMSVEATIERRLARARETRPRRDRPPCVIPYTGGSEQRAQDERVGRQQRRRHRSRPASATRTPARRGRPARRPTRTRGRNGAGRARADSGSAARATARRGAR